MKTGVRRSGDGGTKQRFAWLFTPSPDLARPGRRRDDGRRLHTDSGADAPGHGDEARDERSREAFRGPRSWIASREWVGL